MDRNDVNSTATSDAVTFAFFERLGRFGLRNISISDICDDCHISRTTFYRYFSDKYDVLEKKEASMLKGTLLLSKQDISEEEFITVLEFIKKNMFYYRTILDSDFSRRFMVKWSNIINEGFTKRMAEEDKVLDELSLRILSGGFLAGMSFWIERRPNLSLPEVSDALYKLLFLKYPITE